MRHRPIVNYALVAANVIIFILGFNAGNIPKIDAFMLHPDSPELYQFISSAFLHADFWHLAGNMVFLWVFGNALNDRFGNISYLAFYLAGGVSSAVGYVLLSGNAPVLGASGAIAAVTGAYLVLFPRVRVTLLMWLYIITTFDISSLYFILFQFLWNIFMSAKGIVGQATGNVAYVAHSSGYIFGILIAVVLLATKVLERDAFDLLNLMQSARRRSRYRRMAAQGYDPFNNISSKIKKEQNRWAKAKAVETGLPPTPEPREAQLRKEISEAHSRHDMAEAADKYLQLIQLADETVLSQQQQLDIANQLMSTEKYPPAADAYERFIKNYSSYEHIADIHLMLGLVYGRYLHKYEKAQQSLEQAIEKLEDPQKIELARADLQNVRNKQSD